MMKCFHLGRVIQIGDVRDFSTRETPSSVSTTERAFRRWCSAFPYETGYDPVNLEVPVGILMCRSGNDQRSPSFVDQYAVYIVYDRVVKLSLNIICESELLVIVR